MENSEWRDRLRSKGLRYMIRDDIEDIMKTENIDRSKFHEYSKTGYLDIIRKFYFTFCDIVNYPVKTRISLTYNDLHFRADLSEEIIDCFFRTDEWSEYMDTIKAAIPENTVKLFLILSEGWVYEGEVGEVFEVLRMTPHIRDFYIISPKYDWFIAASYIEDNATMFR